MRNSLTQVRTVAAAVEQIDLQVLLGFLDGISVMAEGTGCSSAPAAEKLPLRAMTSRTGRAFSEILMVRVIELGYYVENN